MKCKRLHPLLKHLQVQGPQDYSWVQWMDRTRRTHKSHYTHNYDTPTWYRLKSAKGKANRAEAENVWSVELLGVFPQGLMATFLFPALMHDNIHRVFPNRDTHSRLGVQRFYCGSISEILPIQLIPVFTPSRGLANRAFHSKSHCYYFAGQRFLSKQKYFLNDNFSPMKLSKGLEIHLPGDKSKGQHSLWVEVSFYCITRRFVLPQTVLLLWLHSKNMGEYGYMLSIYFVWSFLKYFFQYCLH